MSINDDPFQEKDNKKPEDDKDKPAAWNAEPSEDDDEDVIELSHALEDSDDEEILDLEEALDTVSEEMDVMELTEEVPSAAEAEGDILDLTTGNISEMEDEEEILDLTMEVTEEPASDDEFLHLDELNETTAENAESTPSEPVEPAAALADEDKQILELIDDIQATLEKDTETPETVSEPDALENKIEETFDEKAAESAVSIDDLEESSNIGMETEPQAVTSDIEDASDDEQGTEEPTFLGDEETLEAAELSESDSEFVDHLGLDLTSEFSREIFGETAGAAYASVDPAMLEKSIEHVIDKMLAQEDGPLMQAIRQAVDKRMKDNDG